MLRGSTFVAFVFLLGNLAYADALPARAPSLGELLYSTHCITCHSTKVHWRDRKIATDWQSLQSQVRHWQGVAGLGWTDQEIAEVARYVNSIYYHFPAPE